MIATAEQIERLYRHGAREFAHLDGATVSPAYRSEWEARVKRLRTESDSLLELINAQPNVIGTAARWERVEVIARELGTLFRVRDAVCALDVAIARNALIGVLVWRSLDLMLQQTRARLQAYEPRRLVMPSPGLRGGTQGPFTRDP